MTFFQDNVSIFMSQLTELRAQVDKMEREVEEMHTKLDALLVISDKLDNILALIAPVHAHAAWVDSLRKRLSVIGLVKDKRISNGESEA